MADGYEGAGFTEARTERIAPVLSRVEGPLGGRLRLLDAARRVSSESGAHRVAAPAPAPAPAARLDAEARPESGKAAEAKRLERLLNSILSLFSQGRLCLRSREDAHAHAHAAAAGLGLQAAAARLRRGRNGDGSGGDTMGTGT